MIRAVSIAIAAEALVLGLCQTSFAASDITIAAIASGRLYVVGTTERPHQPVVLDGQFRTESDEAGKFQYELIYHPARCIVSASIADKAYEAVVGNCGQQGPPGSAASSPPDERRHPVQGWRPRARRDHRVLKARLDRLALPVRPGHPIRPQPRFLAQARPSAHHRSQRRRWPTNRSERRRASWQSPRRSRSRPPHPSAPRLLPRHQQSPSAPRHPCGNPNPNPNQPPNPTTLRQTITNALHDDGVTRRS